jgi:hypothetical protein
MNSHRKRLRWVLVTSTVQGTVFGLIVGVGYALTGRLSPPWAVLLGVIAVVSTVCARLLLELARPARDRPNPKEDDA